MARTLDEGGGVAAQAIGETVKVFDVNALHPLANGGWIPAGVWDSDVAFWIMNVMVRGSDGIWSMTHSIEVQACM